MRAAVDLVCPSMHYKERRPSNKAGFPVRFASFVTECFLSPRIPGAAQLAPASYGMTRSPCIRTIILSQYIVAELVSENATADNVAAREDRDNSWPRHWAAHKAQYTPQAVHR